MFANAIPPSTVALDSLATCFSHPPDSARPWVYWYFMDGNMTREGIKNDLIAMRKAGIGGAIFLQVDVGIPRGPVVYMSPEWKSIVRYAIQEAEKQGIEIDLGTGPGWCGTGGPWITPDEAMQDLVSAKVELQGPKTYSGRIPQPKPRTPFFGQGSMTPDLVKQWHDFYRDEVVLAFPSPKGGQAFPDLDEKSLVYRAPYSSQPGVKPYLYSSDKRAIPDSVIRSANIVDLSGHLEKDGTLHWSVPPGKWTIVRFGRTLTGQTTRPAPAAGLGFETDKFETSGIRDHISKFLDPLVQGNAHEPGKGLTFLHFDSWEMGSQNWSPHFRELFKKQRGYDPIRYLPVMAGKIVDSVITSEKFLWDLRQTSQELIKENHLGTLARYGHLNGLGLSIEPYDMSPAADLTMGGAADAPQGEFWSTGFGFNTNYSIIEAASIGHTNGKSIIGAESFTADDRDGWLQHPGSMKAQTDWALASGINRIIIHRYEHQPAENQFPGMTMGPYGVHWERTESWWGMVSAYHKYISRCQTLLRTGRPVADVLYLNPEGAPTVFQPAPGSTIGDLPDRRAYNFDGCSPETLINRAFVKNGQITFPDGVAYRLLVLPRVKSMTPNLAEKIEQLAKHGATILGAAPTDSPSLSGGKASDGEVAQIASKLWKGANHRFGRGLIIDDRYRDEAPVTVSRAHWIWAGEGDASKAAPVGHQTFTRSFNLANVNSLKSAEIALTADNRFKLFINDTQVASGTDFHQIQIADILTELGSGKNVIRVEADNDGDSPNPAGLLGTLEIEGRNGSKIEIFTDSTWTTTDGPAKDLGPWNMAPWGLNSSTAGFPAMYPDYSTTSQVLKSTLQLKPDLDSDDKLRYAHRRFEGSDIYFVGNRSSDVAAVVAKFRADSGNPEWWDPMSGQVQDLPNFTQSGGITSIPMRFEPLQSGFVLFRPGHRSVRSKGPNFPALSALQTIEGAWHVRFDPKFGGPTETEFPALTDWSQSLSDSIRYFSGESIYSKDFIIDFEPETGLALSLGNVKNIAQVKLNGVDIGITWCAPWRLSIPSGVLHAGSNHLQIKIANLWVNRLIGDSMLPESQRFTKTTWSPYGPNSKLQPSGLLGPVQILGRSNF